MSATRPGWLVPVRTGRMEAFSDGVIAIIVTVMVLELKLPPAAAEGSPWQNLFVPLLPKLIAYGWSFLMVAIMWVNHNQLLHHLRRPSAGVVWANNNLLFWMSLIPLGTSFLGEHLLVARALALYGAILFATAASFTMLRTCAADSEADNESFRASHRQVIRKSWLGTAIYGVAVPLAFVSPYLAIACIVLVPAMFFLPKRLTGE